MLIQNASWPGVVLVETCEYVAQHGITPGRAILTTYPQTARPLEFGDLVFTDGLRTFTLYDCKVDKVDATRGPQGDTYTIEIVDRRWRWAFGGVSGNYNQKDDRGKLVPWSIRSPQELAAICLKEMGERNPVVILPPGLPRAAGANLDKYLKVGQNFPQTLTNPECVWDHTVPAQALARLVENWGCRIIYQPVKDRVLITPLGKGSRFPNLPSELIAANVEQTAAPKYVACFSTDPILFQIRFFLEAVGREWDHSYLPIDELSYAPIDIKKVQKSQIVRYFSSTGLGLLVNLEWVDKAGDTHARTVFVSQGDGGGTDAGKLDVARARFLGFPDVAAAFVLERFSGPEALRFTSRVVNQPFSLQVFDPDGNATWCGVVLLQKGGNGLKGTWNNCPPPFENVQATDRLSFTEAQGLAQDSVLRCFRIVNKDLHAKEKGVKGRPITLPIVGKIKRRQQFVLTDTKVDQVAPAPRIPGAANKGGAAGVNLPGVIPGGGVLPEFYNGYSRGQGATVTGSIWKNLSGTTVNYWLAPGATENTDPTERVFVDFGVDAKEQLIKFNSPVFKYAPGAGGGAYLEVPELILETGVYVLGDETNQFVKWEQFLRILNGTGPTEWFPREDMKVGVALRYDGEGRVVKTDYDGVQDANQRAGYYMRGIGTKYQIKGGEIRQFIGIVPHDLDGYCQQISASIGGGGPTTRLGGNTEFYPSIATYPARRRAENLPPDKSAALANQAERQWYDEKRAQ